MQRNALGTVIAVLSTVLGCQNGATTTSSTTTGSGVVKTESRAVAAFDRVELTIAATITISVGGEQSMAITTDDNILELITTTVADGHLVIGCENTISPSVPITIDISIPSLAEVNLTGAGTISISGVNSETLELAIQGAGDINVSGKVDALAARISGAGNIGAAGLATREAVVRLTGTGSASVSPTETLDAIITGVGSITYAGDPEVTQKISGIGTVRRR
ncbi:MAG: DUF2807 domain-containing protein [Phycisphaerae bacterium]|nr:DUF2807 domain-containing protein [Phycisphaerae bacterium]